MKLLELKNQIISSIPEAEEIFNLNISTHEMMFKIITLTDNDKNLNVLVDLGIFEKKQDRINRHDCVDCALKHVSTASTIIIEMLNGYNNDDYEMYLIGNLNEAQEQITGIDIGIANELRNLRIDIFEISKVLSIKHLELIREIYTKIKKMQPGNIIINKPNKPIQIIKSKHKPCGSCGGSKNISTP